MGARTNAAPTSRPRDREWRGSPRTWIAGAIASSAVLLVATLLVAVGATRAADLRASLAAQSLASPQLDALANAHTILGQGVVAVAIAGILAVLARRRGGRRLSWAAPLLIVATGPAELALKYALSHPGPPDALSRSWTAALSIPLDGPSSFPSGHVARLTFLLVVAYALFPSRATAAAAAAFFSFTVFVRVYIGDHWASDVVGGAALGGLAGCVAAWILRRQGVCATGTEMTRGEVV